MRAAMDYSVPRSIDAEGEAIICALTAPRLAQQIPNNLLARSDLEFFLSLCRVRF
jgi:hypothetical protein